MRNVRGVRTSFHFTKRQREKMCRYFETLSCTITNIKPTWSDGMVDETFRAFFGISSFIMGILWQHIVDSGAVAQAGYEPIHLLWTCLFLKLYSSNVVLARMCHVDPKTYRHWVWPLIRTISNLRGVVSDLLGCCAIA